MRNFCILYPVLHLSESAISWKCHNCENFLFLANLWNEPSKLRVIFIKRLDSIFMWNNNMGYFIRSSVPMWFCLRGKNFHFVAYNVHVWIQCSPNKCNLTVLNFCTANLICVIISGERCSCFSLRELPRHTSARRLNRNETEIFFLTCLFPLYVPVALNQVLHFVLQPEEERCIRFLPFCINSFK